MRDLREFVAWNELMDLGYEGYPFMWPNNRESLPIQQRLDRRLVTLGWHNSTPIYKIRLVVLEGSNHALLLLSTEKFRECRGRKFSYDACWSKMKECRELVSGEWKEKFGGFHAFRFCEKMKTLRRRLKTWYKGKGKNSKKMIDQLKEEIRAAYKSKEFATKAVKQKERELRDVHKEEEAYWKAKSKIQWLREGDKNTKFFRAQTLKRRRFNQIWGIKDSHGVWHKNENEICDTATAYFVELF